MINLNAMDMGLSIGFFAMFALFGSLNYSTVLVSPFHEWNCYYPYCFIITFRCYG